MIRFQSFLEFFLSYLLMSFLIGISSAQADQEPPKIGNFIMPFSQQPGPLLGIGENILEKNQYQYLLYADDYAGVNQHFVDVYPAFLYGITDALSILVSTPIAASYQTNQYKSRGFEDAFLQLEYNFYNKSTSTYYDVATVLANVTAPTGSIDKNPSTGVGSPSFLLGATFDRTYVDWFFFTSYGGIFTTAKNGTKFGNNYLYQGGFGRTIANTKDWLFALILEGTGTYSQQDRVHGVIDPDSGGNEIYMTPSLWFSTKHLIVQSGVGYAVAQHLYGQQNRDTYLLVGGIAWTV